MRLIPRQPKPTFWKVRTGKKPVRPRQAAKLATRKMLFSW